MKKEEKQKSKTPFVLCLIGVILGFFFTIKGIVSYFLLKNIGGGPFNEFFNNFGFDFSSFLLYSFIANIFGFLICIVLLFYIINLTSPHSSS